MKNYKVTIINMGEPMEAYHYGKTEKQIRKQYALEQLKIVSIEEVK